MNATTLPVTLRNDWYCAPTPPPADLPLTAAELALVGELTNADYDPAAAAKMVRSIPVERCGLVRWAVLWEAYLLKEGSAREWRIAQGLRRRAAAHVPAAIPGDRRPAAYTAEADRIEADLRGAHRAEDRKQEIGHMLACRGWLEQYRWSLRPEVRAIIES